MCIIIIDQPNRFSQSFGDWPFHISYSVHAQTVKPVVGLPPYFSMINTHDILQKWVIEEIESAPKKLKVIMMEAKLDVIIFKNRDSRAQLGQDLGCLQPLSEQYWNSPVSQKQSKLASILVSLNQNTKLLNVGNECLPLLWIEDYNKKHI